MKKTTKLLLTSLLTLAVCISMICGATFALFTSESSVNITVSSGVVDMRSTLAVSSVYSAQWSSDLGDYERKEIEPIGDVYTFSNKGTLMLKDDASVEVVNITPGDGFVLAVEIKNYSTVATKYRLEMSSTDSGLLGGMQVKYLKDDVELSTKGNKIKYTEWQNLDAATDASSGDSVGTIYVEVNMPITTGNDYNGEELGCAFNVSVFAVQQNGMVSDPVDYAIKPDESTGKTAEDVLIAAFAEVQPGETIRLDSDVDAIGATEYLRIVQDDVTLDLNDHSINIKKNKGDLRLGYKHLDENIGDEDPTKVVIQNGTILIDDSVENVMTAIIVEAGSTVEFRNVHFKSISKGDFITAVQFEPSNRHDPSKCTYCASLEENGTHLSCSFEECVFDDASIKMANSSRGNFAQSDIKFSKCEFNYSVGNSMIDIVMSDSTFTVEDCEFNVDLTRGSYFSVICFVGNSDNTTVNITGCSLIYSNFGSASSAWDPRGILRATDSAAKGKVTVNYSGFTVVGTGDASEALPLFSNYASIKETVTPGEGNSYTYNDNDVTFDIKKP